MTFPTYPPPQADPPLDPRKSLPTMYDLPSEDPPDAWYRIEETEARVAESEQRAIALEQQLKESQQQVIEAQERAKRLAARLRELGIDPEELT